MEKKDDYISGTHHYWIHFICGFLFGAAIGAYVTSTFLDNSLFILVAAIVSGLWFGFSCGKWGERAWKSISEWFRIWF